LNVSGFKHYLTRNSIFKRINRAGIYWAICGWSFGLAQVGFQVELRENKEKERERGPVAGPSAWADVAKWPCSPMTTIGTTWVVVLLVYARAGSSGRKRSGQERTGGDRGRGLGEGELPTSGGASGSAQARVQGLSAASVTQGAASPVGLVSLGPATTVAAPGGPRQRKRVCKDGETTVIRIGKRGREKGVGDERSLARHPRGNHAGVVCSCEQRTEGCLGTLGEVLWEWMEWCEGVRRVES
jgi:hypothetical protein